MFTQRSEMPVTRLVIRSLFVSMPLLVAFGCASNQGRYAGVEEAERYVNRPVTSAPPPSDATRVAAYVNGRAISPSAMQQRLLESGGATILEEFVLEQQLREACAEANVEITDADIAREERIFLDAMRATGLSSGSAADARLLRDLRRTRGLGDARYDALLQRTAMLRRLAEPFVTVTPASIELAYRLRYGTRHRVRIITVPTTRDAQQAATRLRAGEPFEQVAVDLSTDVSASRGGLLAPLHLEDPSYPAPVRASIRNLSPGGVSSPIALDAGFAIVRLEAIVPPPANAPSMAAARADMERESRLVQERLEMNRIARELLEDADIRIEDATLRSMWDARSQG